MATSASKTFRAFAAGYLSLVTLLLLVSLEPDGGIVIILLVPLTLPWNVLVLKNYAWAVIHGAGLPYLAGHFLFSACLNVLTLWLVGRLYTY